MVKKDRLVTLIISGDMKNAAANHLTRVLKIERSVPYVVTGDSIQIQLISQNAFDAALLALPPAPGHQESFDVWLTSHHTYIEVRVQ